MKILVCGDFVPINRGVSHVNNSSAINTDVKRIISNHDLKIVNLEAPIAENSSDNKIVKDGPHLCTSPSTVQYLSSCGFNCVTLANNHFYDFGSDGVNNTLNAVNKFMGEGKIGGGVTIEEQRSPFVIQNEKIAIFNYCESESSVGHPYGSNRLDPITAYYDISNAKAKENFVIVIIHGGHEGYQLPSPRMKSLYHFLVDCGADVIINHHQHCFSGYENYKGSMIFYGLGNFYFDDFSKHGFIPNGWNEGYMVSLDIVDKKLISHEIIPYEQCKGLEPIVRLMNEEENNSFNNRIKELNQIIADDNLVSEHFKMFSDTKVSDVLRNLSPYSNKWLLRLYNRKLLPFNISKNKAAVILNMIRCESLRDVCMSVLSKI